MYNKEFVLYMKETINLIKSLTIKSDSTVTSLNEYAESLGFAIQYDVPQTQPYYLNLAGIYHPINKPMFVTSLDTLSKIPFTREVLLKHKNTLREYQKMGEYYESLYEENPDQEILIRGILNPIPIEKSFKAIEGTILYYAKNFVEDNEYDLIPELQSFIYIFFDNWHNAGYKYTDELYDAAFFGVLAASLVGRVLNIRLSKCGTSQVHSFHLWAKLGSHFYLDRYRDYIPKETAMWLYRNIDDICANLGQHYTFEKLIKNILTNNTIPVSHLVMKNNEEKLNVDYEPEPYIFKERLNTKDTGVVGDNIISTSNLLSRMMPLAEHNPKNIIYDIEDTDFRSKYSQTSSNHTKVFEALLGQGDSNNSPNLISDIISYLAYAIFTGLYNKPVIIKNNKGELVKVNTEQAFLVWIYIAHKLQWVEFNIIPEMFFKRVPRVSYGSYKQYRKAAHPKYVDDIEIKTAMLLLDSGAPIYDSEEFSKRALEYNQNKYLHFVMYATRQELNSYVRTRQMIDMFYINGKYDCVHTGKTYVEFFESIGLSVDTYEQSYLEILFISIFGDLTGFDYNKIGSLSNKQKKLVEVVKLLSSYTIKFVTQETSNSGGTTNPNGVTKSLRVNDGKIRYRTKHDVLFPNIIVKEHHARERFTGRIPFVKLDFNKERIKLNYLTRLEGKLTVRGSGKYVSNIDVPLSMVRVLPKKSYYLPDYLPNNKLNGLLQIRFVDELTKLETYLSKNLLDGLNN